MIRLSELSLLKRAKILIQSYSNTIDSTALRTRELVSVGPPDSEVTIFLRQTIKKVPDNANSLLPLEFLIWSCMPIGWIDVAGWVGTGKTDRTATAGKSFPERLGAFIWKRHLHYDADVLVIVSDHIAGSRKPPQSLTLDVIPDVFRQVCMCFFPLCIWEPKSPDEHRSEFNRKGSCCISASCTCFCEVT
jgi:hypothetical protein